MAAPPEVEIGTARLVLRPICLADAAEVEALVSDRAIAMTTLSIPHPYPKGGAAEYIRTSQAKWENGAAAQFALRTRAEGILVGSVGLTIERAHERAEMGYWIGKPFWNMGYATEAAAAVLRHAFRALGLKRVFAHHMLVNPASGRVLEKIGMKHEAVIRGHIMKDGEARDVAAYGITHSDYDCHAPRN